MLDGRRNRKDDCISAQRLLLCNATLKTGKNYFSVSVAEYDDLEELDFYKSHEIPYEYPTNVKKVDLYDSVRLQTMSETSEAVFELSDPVLGSDGERTIYLVVECDEDETVQYICFVS